MEDHRFAAFRARRVPLIPVHGFLKVTYLLLGAFLPIAPWYPNVT
jgi:hypothetical protein